MVSRIVAISLLWLISQSVWADLIATVSSSTLQEGDTVVLTLTDTDGSGDQPDLTPLRRDFQILSNSSSQNHSIVNGRRSSQVQWIITLYPTRVGRLTIPALGKGRHLSKAINISVSKGDTNQTLPTAQSPVITSSLDKAEVYLGGQVLLKIQILHLGNLASAALNPPEVENTTVTQVYETSFQRIINNSRVTVIERVYALHPEQAGLLEIPGQLLQADMATRSQRSIFGSSSTKLVMRKSPAHELNVLTLPTIADGKETITASEVSISQEWNSPLANLAVGDSITRSLTITAKGAMAVAIPPIFEDRIAGIKQYQDQPVLDDKLGQDGLTGIRKQSTAYVLTEAGEYQLPAIIVYWINAETGKLQSASLPSQFIRVAAAADAPLVDNTAAEATTGAQAPSQNTVISGAQYSGLWFWLTWVFAGLWLLTLISWLLFGSKKVKNTAKTAAKPENHQQQLFDQLLKACKNNEASKALHLFNVWGKTLNPNLRNQHQICDYLGDDHIRKSIVRADKHSYEANADHAWNGAQLANHLQQVRKQLNKQDTDKLADIYPQ